MRKYLLLTSFILQVSLLCSQDLRLQKVFGDHMILQRESPVRVWGWSSPGKELSVTIDGQSVTTQAGEDGKWECMLPAHSAGGPYELIISGDKKVQFEDVWFGDVWIAGGQSNMAWNLKSEVDNWQEEVADSDYPQIRFFTVPNVIAFSPKEDIDGGSWLLATPQNSPDFSAVAWFFAKHNHLEKDVPVGIIESNWGGTPAESWTSSERLLELNAYRDETKKVLEPGIDWKSKLEENERNNQERNRIFNSKEFLNTGVQKSNFDDSSWEIVQLPNPKDFDDVVWLRKQFDWKGSKKDARLSLGRLTINQTVFINGKQIEGSLHGRVVEIPRGMLKKKNNLIAVRLINTWNNIVTIGMDRELWIEDNDQKLDLAGDWKFSNTIEPSIPEYIRYSQYPTVLFNGMINPIAGYTIQGAIWYQGESNAGRHDVYHELFSTMIQDWRTRWRQGDFPFLFVQLANYMARLDEPSDPDWARLRDAQTQTLELKNTGMAVAIDIGNEVDIHPRNKQDVGKRLWLAADKVAFGNDVVHSGPVYESHQTREAEVIVTFNQVGSGLKAAGPQITGFAVAGKDRKYYWAEGEVIAENKISLTSDHVKEPVHVRYAWANNPACNLYNEEGLPAVPFRTDDWPQE
ncbi:MAG: sialate O-acetylesterase [Cyclobacteriaceae bacterium]